MWPVQGHHCQQMAGPELQLPGCLQDYGFQVFLFVCFSLIWLVAMKITFLEGLIFFFLSLLWVKIFLHLKKNAGPWIHYSHLHFLLLFLLSLIISISLQLLMLIIVCHKPIMLLRLKAAKIQFLRPVLKDTKTDNPFFPSKRNLTL